jgi:hypothetical protein
LCADHAVVAPVDGWPSAGPGDCRRGVVHRRVTSSLQTEPVDTTLGDYTPGGLNIVGIEMPRV